MNTPCNYVVPVAVCVLLGMGAVSKKQVRVVNPQSSSHFPNMPAVQKNIENSTGRVWDFVALGPAFVGKFCMSRHLTPFIIGQSITDRHQPDGNESSVRPLRLGWCRIHFNTKESL